MSLPSRTDIFLDNTKISSYKDCPRKYFLRHVMDWRGEGIARPLAFGGAWHSAMDIVWQFLGKAPDETVHGGAFAAFLNKWEEEGLPAELDAEQEKFSAPRTPRIASEMLWQYMAVRNNFITESELIAIEQPFAVPLPNLDNHWYVGRLDKTVRNKGQLLIIEHKTTALYRKDGYFDPLWVESWHMDSQVKGYEFGGNMYHGDINGIWVDGALCHKTEHAGFKFIPVKHTFDIIAEWLRDTEQWVERINRDQLLWEGTGELTGGIFPKNENSCYGKFGACVFLDICRSIPKITKGDTPPFGYIVEKWSPFDTLGLEKLLAKEPENA